ncbi:hypothetical protein DEFDS_0867 [Deferribacter desulfuricans SSM1]|uniref:Uncharacterized protein n=1 Tax=Deferribacter desulfuricans (strain DSM 14783 / JCM 11476 / NBRC 101012 / SSM1) TaxID=639282 RepID=D3PCM0_DEFDS|nr:hypothetical protein [Deferribacter desulfuricans]BAI80343.1 hypothetical protein DEFDS_0867 [Deferribacter desulfuricans SSM1]
MVKNLISLVDDNIKFDNFSFEEIISIRNNCFKIDEVCHLFSKLSKKNLKKSTIYQYINKGLLKTSVLGNRRNRVIYYKSLINFLIKSRHGAIDNELYEIQSKDELILYLEKLYHPDIVLYELDIKESTLYMYVRMFAIHFYKIADVRFFTENDVQKLNKCIHVKNEYGVDASFATEFIDNVMENMESVAV